MHGRLVVLLLLLLLPVSCSWSSRDEVVVVRLKWPEHACHSNKVDMFYWSRGVTKVYWKHYVLQLS
jgi:hypothetical protein